MTLPAGPFSKGPAGFSARWGLERVFGPEQVEAAVEADKQREQAVRKRQKVHSLVER